MTTLKRTKQDVVSEFRSTEVLVSARKVFAKKGFAVATMDDIAAAAGLAKGTLYLYFKSKREVYLKTLQQGCAELLAQVATNMPTMMNPSRLMSIPSNQAWPGRILFSGV